MIFFRLFLPLAFLFIGGVYMFFKAVESYEKTRLSLGTMAYMVTGIIVIFFLVFLIFAALTP